MRLIVAVRNYAKAPEKEQIPSVHVLSYGNLWHKMQHVDYTNITGREVKYAAFWDV
jgi:hypothetical protein